MSDFSLVPERQLVFSPGLAATVGLEEAILAQHLQQLFDSERPRLREGYEWLRVERDYLLRTLPFWNTVDLHRIVRSLVDKGVLLVDSPPLHSADALEFAFNQSRHQAAERAPQPEAPARRSAGLLPAHWSPSEDLLQLLGLNHNIPREFALEQLEDFIFYWRERNEISHAWENKFRQLVISRWRQRQQAQAESFRVPEEAPLNRDWRPSADAMEILERSEIDPGFIEDTIPEFILYWRERGAAPRELNSKFIQHIRMTWGRYSASLKHGAEPAPISSRWFPSEDVFDILRLSHIDIDFARSLVPEFIVYWKDSGQAHASWNSKFLQHAKYHWAKRHQLADAGRQHDGQKPDLAGRTRDRSLEQDLSDTTWAD